MHHWFFLLSLALFSGGALAGTTWRGTTPQSLANGSGEISAAGGAAVTLSAESMGANRFVGAITTIDAASFRGREVLFAGRLLVKSGTGKAALWVRADGAEGALAFASTSDQSVRFNEGSQVREVRLYIPSGATSLKLWVSLDSAGRVDVEHLTLKNERATSNGVSAYDMLDTAISFIRANALNANRLDWDAEQKSLLTPDLKNLPAPEAYSRIRKVLSALEDHHSSVHVPRVASTRRTSAIATQAVEARPVQDIGYLLVPGLRGSDSRASDIFSTQLCEHIASLAKTASKGWIIDLRDNTGGNMWPMIKGLRSLLGDADIGAIRDRNGVVTAWRSQPSKACGVDLSRNRVAVLVGPRTASSGEAVAVAFRARPGTGFFGQPTAGLSTANQSFALPDGGVIALTTAVFLDRSGEAYLQGIKPENLVPHDQYAIAAAAAWLRTLP
ncbi:S41 family peptidase [Stenotrophomonas terrae]|uniref:S41 family peptidase n=1 Tax=Stenotrophomonas terrae TaxID=405446 RepID=UPI00320AC5DD